MFLLSKQSIAIFLMVIMSTMASTDFCSTCQNLSGFVREMVHNQTETNMKINFYKMCLNENEGTNSRIVSFLISHLLKKKFSSFEVFDLLLFTFFYLCLFTFVYVPVLM